MSDPPRKLRIQPPHGYKDKWFTIWDGSALRAMADSRGEAEAALAFLQANIDAGRHPLSAASIGDLALARVDMLSARVEALLDKRDHAKVSIKGGKERQKRRREE